MTQIPSDEILESLYKLRIWESEKLKTVLDLYNVEIHQKISRPNDCKGICEHNSQLSVNCIHIVLGFLLLSIQCRCTLT